MEQKYGLRPRKFDPRRFSHKKHYGAFDVSLLPKEFSVGEPLKVKNQLFSDFCTGYSSSSVSEFQELVELCADYIYAKAKQIEGRWNSFGADPDDVCKAHIKFGAIEQKDAPFTLETKSRDFLANWENWDKSLDEKAAVHKKGAYFDCDAGKDLFDSMRIAMFVNKLEKRAIFTGCYWQPEWTYAGGGVVPKISNNSKSSPHAVMAFGWKEINGEPYLMILNSYGTEVGNGGIFYFPREVINKLFMFGHHFSDYDPEAIKAMQWRLLQMLYDYLILLSRLISRSVGYLFVTGGNERDKNTSN